MRHRFCMRFHGNLKDMIADVICLELEECKNIYSLLQKVLTENKVPLSIDELAVTRNNETLNHRASTCDVGEVEIYRITHGG